MLRCLRRAEIFFHVNEGKTAMIEVIISGGQTGADRAALDFALERGFEIQGYCPQGRRATDGSLDEKYPLQETKSAAYPQRTRQNVKLADVTIIFNGLPDYSSGTHTTIKYAREHKKKFKVLQGFPDVAKDAAALERWLTKHKPRKLNVAGNGEEKCPGIYAHVLAVLRRVI
ncbi:MAG: putative molybdenum carrier protein [Deltaproteobacteria bacterium]|jgi:predicted Rossmann fold nucleotide-binding protein DprA/Smf involved in DNA uptake|nr:putative molybdenum carrier protein [Deltaproteobacteria bacterium]